MKILPIYESILKEADYSYHASFGNDIKNLDDYIGGAYGGGTDSLQRMSGRGTGHFGSGTYFATYDNDSRWEKEIRDSGKPLITIGNTMLAADLDKFGLYRVKSTEQGMLLHNTLKKINDFFYGYVNYGKLDERLKQSLMEIKKAVNQLGLEVPDKFLKLISKYAQYYRETGTGSANKNNPNFKQIDPSLSTIFMEMNGFNGVNVNNIKGLDNTTYGSVIYNLNKVTDTPKETPKTKASWETFDYDVKNIETKIEYAAKDKFTLLNLTNANNKEINMLLKVANPILDLGFKLDYMVEKNRLTQEQSNYIRYIYPIILKPKLNEIEPKQIPPSTFVILLKKGMLNYDPNKMVYIAYDKLNKLYGEEKETVINYLKSIKNRVTDEDAKDRLEFFDI